MAYSKPQRTLIRSLILGMAVILLSVLVSRMMQKGSGDGQSQFSFAAPIAEVREVRTGDHPIILEVEGRLKALNRIELFAEVGGILTNSNFREGAKFDKGEAILRIDDSEILSQLKAQRSALLGSLNATLPDLALDYPAEYPIWKSYAESISINEGLPALPEFKSRKLEQFLSGRGILNSYYSIKGQERRQSKYLVRAPFNGIVSQANLEPGTQIRPGQLIGLFIKEGLYELEAPLPPDNISFVEIGKEVKVKNPETGSVSKGQISRINAALDPLTQMINVYVSIEDNELKDGMYVSASLGAGTIRNCILIEQRLFSERETIYQCNPDSSLTEIKPQIAYRGEKFFYVKGIENGNLILSRPVNGAHNGLKVRPVMSNMTESS